MNRTLRIVQVGVTIVVEATLEPKAPVVHATNASSEVRLKPDDTGAKPKFRGIPDVVATFLALPAVLMLIYHARHGVHAVAAAVYGVCLILLFAVSATYHTFMWSKRMRQIWRRFDHSMVYMLIAGSYTPLCLTALTGKTGTVILTLVWSIAALGMVKSFLWSSAPRLLNTVIYIGMGWLLLPIIPEIYRGAGLRAFVLLAIGGVVYTLGAVIYARRWPNPDPKIFGYHEVFHLFVIAAGACHYATMWNLLT